MTGTQVLVSCNYTACMSADVCAPSVEDTSGATLLNGVHGMQVGDLTIDSS